MIQDDARTVRGGMTATMRSYVSAVSQIWDTCLITLTRVSISEVISGRRLWLG